MNPCTSLHAMLDLGTREVCARIATASDTDRIGAGRRVKAELRDVLADPERCGFTAGQLAQLTAVTSQVPLPADVRVRLYRAALDGTSGVWVVDGRVTARPSQPLQLYRGALADQQATGPGSVRGGASWAADAAHAAHYVIELRQLGYAAGVWQTMVPPAALLGRVDVGGWSAREVIVDPALLGDVELTGIEPDAGVAALVRGSVAERAALGLADQQQRRSAAAWVPRAAAAGRGPSGFDMIRGR